MHLAGEVPLPASGAAFEKADLLVRIPVAMMNPAAHEPNQPRHPGGDVAFVIAGVEKAEDGGAELGRQFFVAVQGQNPLLGAMVEAQVLLIAMPEEILVMDLGAIFCRDLQRSVRRAGIDDDDFTRQRRRAGEAARKIGLLIVGNDGDGNGQWKVGHGPGRDLVWRGSAVGQGRRQVRWWGRDARATRRWSADFSPQQGGAHGWRGNRWRTAGRVDGTRRALWMETGARSVNERCCGLKSALRA